MHSLGDATQPLTVLQRFDDLASRRPTTVFLEAASVDRSGWTYAELVDASARLAGGLHDRGVRRGDRVAVHSRNIGPIVVAYLACLRSGAIAVPLNTRFTATEVEAVLAATRPKAYFAQSDLYVALKSSQTEIAHMPDECFWTDGRHIRPESRLRPGVAEVFRTDSSETEGSDPAFLLATSGTTGDPKLVVWTQNTISAIAKHFHNDDHFSDDVILVQMPMAHAGGLLQMIYAMAYGAKLVIASSADPDLILEAIAKHSCTSFLGTPAICAELARVQAERPRDLSSLRISVVAGDICPAEIEESFRVATGCPLVSRWGATEDVATALRGRRTGPFATMPRSGSWKVVAADGADVATGQIGELLTRSPGTTPGYWREDGGLDVFPNGWFHSGDLVEKVACDEIRYVARRKDLIVRDGSNISPSEVERILAKDARVLDAAVIGIRDDELGQRVGAMLVLADGCDDAALGDIIRTCGDRLASYKIPDLISVAHELPRTSIGKIDRKSIRGAHLEWTDVNTGIKKQGCYLGLS